MDGWYGGVIIRAGKERSPLYSTPKRIARMVMDGLMYGIYWYTENDDGWWCGVFCLLKHIIIHYLLASNNDHIRPVCVLPRYESHTRKSR